MAALNQHLLSRRSFCLCCVSAAALGSTGGWLSPSQAYAEARNIVDLIRDDAAKAPIKVHRLRRNVSILEGSGGNIAVLTGPDGKVFIDAGITASRPRILEAASSLSHDPIKYLINTHWHFDHADGNEWLNAEGAAIVAHENTQRHLLAAQRVEDWNFNFPASPLAAIPTEVFTSTKSLTLNGSTLSLKYYGPAHTDSDISVTIYRSRNSPLWRYVLERHLSVHRLLDRREYRWNDKGCRGKSRCSNRQNNRDPRPRPAGKQQDRAPGVSRYARCHPHECRKTEAAGPFARRGHRGQANCFIRRPNGVNSSLPRPSSPV